jgi:hypothetical protein
MVVGLCERHLPALPPEASKVAKGCDFEVCAQVAGCALGEADPTLARLEPDLVGEFFVLTTLKPHPFKGSPHPWLPETAWRLEGGHRMVGRARQNFPDHESLKLLEIVVPGVAASRFSRAIRLFIEHPGSPTDSILAMCHDLQSDLAIDPAARLVMAEMSCLVPLSMPERSILTRSGQWSMN